MLSYISLHWIVGIIVASRWTTNLSTELFIGIRIWNHTNPKKPSKSQEKQTLDHKKFTFSAGFPLLEFFVVVHSYWKNVGKRFVDDAKVQLLQKMRTASSLKPSDLYRKDPEGG